MLGVEYGLNMGQRAGGPTLDKESTLPYFALLPYLPEEFSHMTPEEMEKEGSELMRRGFH
jgi:hypothetical protein